MFFFQIKRLLNKTKWGWEMVLKTTYLSEFLGQVSWFSESEVHVQDCIFTWCDFSFKAKNSQITKSSESRCLAKTPLDLSLVAATCIHELKVQYMYYFPMEAHIQRYHSYIVHRRLCILKSVALKSLSFVIC